MRKNQKFAHTGKVNIENSPFILACQQMHQAANACFNWLNMVQHGSVQMVHAELGCVRSTRLARLHPGSRELTSQSALQWVVLPAQFDDPGQHGYDHQRWSLFVYSWMGSELTEQLRQHLATKMELKDCTFFLVKDKGCEMFH